MDPGHKARKNPSDNADLGFYAYEKKKNDNRQNIETLGRNESVLSMPVGRLLCWSRVEASTKWQNY